MDSVGASPSKISSQPPFSEDIFTALGAENMTSEEKAALVTKLFEIVLARVLTILRKRFSPEQRQTMEELMHPDTFEALELYLQSQADDYATLFEHEALLVRRQFIQRSLGGDHA